MYKCHDIEWFDGDECLICEEQNKGLNKYFWRRLGVGALATPLVGAGYLLVCTALIGFGAEPTDTPLGYFTNGVVLGAVATVLFALHAIGKVKKWTTKVFGF
jgi:hypothetical protein